MDTTLVLRQNPNLIDDEKLEYIKRLVAYVKQNVFASNGFSFTGSKEDIVGYRYKSDGFISFDGGRKNADWITFVINSFLT